MSPEVEQQQSAQIDYAAQAAAVINGAFAEQMQDDYTVETVANPDYAGMDKFGEYYALGAFAETGEEAQEIYNKYSDQWKATISALVQKQTEATLWHEVYSKETKTEAKTTVTPISSLVRSSRTVIEFAEAA